MRASYASSPAAAWVRETVGFWQAQCYRVRVAVIIESSIVCDAVTQALSERHLHDRGLERPCPNALVPLEPQAPSGRLRPRTNAWGLDFCPGTEQTASEAPTPSSPPQSRQQSGTKFANSPTGESRACRPASPGPNQFAANDTAHPCNVSAETSSEAQSHPALTPHGRPIGSQTDMEDLTRRLSPALRAREPGAETSGTMIAFRGLRGLSSPPS
jgi:hypothetical protein